MRLKRIGGLLLVFLLAAGMALSLAGCDGNQKAEKLYRVKTRAKIQEIIVAEDALNTAVAAFAASITDSARKEALAAVEALAGLYEQLGELEAPKKYQELRGELLNAAEDAKKGCEVYRTEFTAVTDDSFNSEFVERVSAGDTLLEQAFSVLDKAFDELAVSSGESGAAEVSPGEA